MNSHCQPINLTDEQLRKLQLEMLTILIEFDRICRKHNIQYFLSGGTLLGAVRHQGFIPWDDDVDVEMLRADYERFREVCKQELINSKFFWQDDQNDAGYDWPYGKLRMKNTRYIRIGQEHLVQKTGICIDVFPIDDICDHHYLQRFNEIGTKICRKCLWSKVGCCIEQNYGKRMIYKMLNLIDKKLIMNIFKKILDVVRDEQGGLVVFNGMDSRSARGYVLEKTWFAETFEVEFEGKIFFAPVGYQEILRFWYGDYMKYPDEKDRVLRAWASHIIFSDGTELKG